MEFGSIEDENSFFCDSAWDEEDTGGGLSSISQECKSSAPESAKLPAPANLEPINQNVRIETPQQDNVASIKVEPTTFDSVEDENSFFCDSTWDEDPVVPSIKSQEVKPKPVVTNSQTQNVSTKVEAGYQNSTSAKKFQNQTKPAVEPTTFGSVEDENNFFCDSNWDENDTGGQEVILQNTAKSVKPESAKSLWNSTPSYQSSSAVTADDRKDNYRSHRSGSDNTRQSSSGNYDKNSYEDESARAEVMIPVDKVGLVIGKGGRTIKTLQETTKTKMQIVQVNNYQMDSSVSAQDKTLVITGSKAAVQHAEQTIRDLLSKAPPSRNSDTYSQQSPSHSSSNSYGNKYDHNKSFNGQDSESFSSHGNRNSSKYSSNDGSSSNSHGGRRGSGSYNNDTSRSGSYNNDTNRSYNNDASRPYSNDASRSYSNDTSRTYGNDASRSYSNDASNGMNKGVKLKTTRLPVPKVAVGLIIGKGGETIKKIRADTGAKVQFNPANADSPDSDEQIAVITGNNDQVLHACNLIEELVDTALNSGGQGHGNSGSGVGNRSYNTMSNSNSGGNWPSESCGMGSFGSLGRQCKIQNAEAQFSSYEQFIHHDSITSYSSNSRAPVHEEVEEETITIPGNKVRQLIGKGRDTIRSIIQTSGAYCDVEQTGATSGVATVGFEKVVYIRGYRDQIEHAKELIYEEICQNSVDPKAGLSGDLNCYNNPTEDSYNFGINSTLNYIQGAVEWGQGDQQSHWGQECEQLYYDPSMSHPDTHLASQLGFGSDFSQWIQYYTTGATLHGDPSDSSSQEIKAAPIPPVPVMSATIVQNGDQPVNYLAPPAIYFTLPPIYSGQSTGHENSKHSSKTETSQLPQYGIILERQISDVETIGESTEKHPETDGNKRNGVSSSDPIEVSGGCNAFDGDGSQSLQELQEQSGVAAAKAFSMMQGLGSGSTYTPANGTPGSCTRIVSFYYDSNVNSIVIMNQWHYY